MKRILKRIAIGIAVTLVLGTAGLAVAVVLRQHRTFDAPYPELHASPDATVIARGAYLVNGPAHCADCHADPAATGGLDQPLSGGRVHHLPVGTFYTPNITPDRETGIGRYTDGELARVLRFGVHPSGRAMVPFMPFNDLTDEDLTAVISYLRSRPAVHHEVPAHDVNLLGRFAKAFLLAPAGPTRPVRATVPRGPTVAYGEYLAHSVANCVGCHTKRNLRTGAFVGEPFSGGFELEGRDGTTFVTPNLTPDPKSGRITAWTEDVFVARFQHAVGTASPMPWESFQRMTDDDLRALYRYLRTLPPVDTL